jgi:ATP-dependent Clp protease adaptor protein ClpS
MRYETGHADRPPMAIARPGGLGYKRLVMSDRPLEDLDTGVITESEKELKLPPMYRVLLLNDDYTTMEFVVQVLQSVFHKSPADATQIMLHIHRNGIGVAGVYTHEVAETKVAVVEAMAREHEFPLKCTMEEA